MEKERWKEAEDGDGDHGDGHEDGLLRVVRVRITFGSKLKGRAVASVTKLGDFLNLSATHFLTKIAQKWVAFGAILKNTAL